MHIITKKESDIVISNTDLDWLEFPIHPKVAMGRGSGN